MRKKKNKKFISLKKIGYRWLFGKATFNYKIFNDKLMTLELSSFLVKKNCFSSFILYIRVNHLFICILLLFNFCITVN